MTATDMSQPPAKASAWISLTAMAAALSLTCAAWALVDTRMVDGALNWLKPLKFSLSFMILFGTIALIERRLSGPAQRGRPLRICASVMGLAFVAEMAWIIRQAANGRASHFNLETPFEALMYGTVMAIGALALVASIGVIGWQVRRDTAADLRPATREGIWLGCMISFVLTVIVAGTMSSTARHVGLAPEGSATLPLLGWSAAVGDLRPAHFLSLHAMQVLPLFGLWRDGKSAQAVRQTRFAAALYVVLTLAVFAQALLGHPLIRLG